MAFAAEFFLNEKNNEKNEGNLTRLGLIYFKKSSRILFSFFFLIVDLDYGFVWRDKIQGSPKNINCFMKDL